MYGISIHSFDDLNGGAAALGHHPIFGQLPPIPGE
jgi:hypothetical protein